MLDDPTDVVGQAAVRLGDIGAAFEQHDLRLLIEPTQPSRAGVATRDPTDDDDLHATTSTAHADVRQARVGVCEQAQVLGAARARRADSATRDGRPVERSDADGVA